MRFSSLFVTSLAIATTSIALFLFGLSGTAMSQTATPSAAPLPDIVVDAPKRVARPHKPERHAVARSTVSRRASATAQAPSGTSDAVSAKLAKLAAATGSCAGGCQSSFKTEKEPWHGCSLSSGTWLQCCRNVGNYKTYNECREAGLLTGWRVNEVPWYCSSLALK